MTVNFWISKLGQAVLVLWAAFTISFVLVQLMPGDAVLIRFLNPDMGMTPEDIARIRAFYGSDKPVLEQYVWTAISFLQGDFGYSVQSGVPVSQELLTNLSPTLKLARWALWRRSRWPLSLRGQRPFPRLAGCAGRYSPCLR